MRRKNGSRHMILGLCENIFSLSFSRFLYEFNSNSNSQKKGCLAFTFHLFDSFKWYYVWIFILICIFAEQYYSIYWNNKLNRKEGVQVHQCRAIKLKKNECWYFFFKNRQKRESKKGRIKRSKKRKSAAVKWPNKMCEREREWKIKQTAMKCHMDLSK